MKQMMKKQNDYTDVWRSFGYPRDMGSSSFLRPPPTDFIRAYHMTPSEHAVSDVKQGNLKVARFTDANDPFELLGLNCHDKNLRKLTSHFKDSQNRKTGFLSFTADWTNPVLWSHYADRHKGICLGFDLRKSDVQTIEYSDERLRESLPDDKDPNAIPAAIQGRLCRTKSFYWKYEQEIRVFVELTRSIFREGLYFRPFDQNMQLAEVILGPRCELDLTIIKDIVAETGSNAVVFKTRLAYRSFRVVLDGRTKPAA